MLHGHGLFVQIDWLINVCLPKPVLLAWCLHNSDSCICFCGNILLEVAIHLIDWKIIIHELEKRVFESIEELLSFMLVLRPEVIVVLILHVHNETRLVILLLCDTNQSVDPYTPPEDFVALSHVA